MDKTDKNAVMTLSNIAISEVALLPPANKITILVYYRNIVTRSMAVNDDCFRCQHFQLTCTLACLCSILRIKIGSFKNPQR